MWKSYKCAAAFLMYVLQLNTSDSVSPLIGIFPISTVPFSNISKIKRPVACGDRHFRCSSGQCIRLDQLCDGPADCVDQSDETDNCAKMSCPTFSFRCEYGACISSGYECDSKQDCRDNSDERSPRCKRTTQCGNRTFQCNSEQCIPDTDVCDGAKNCDDGSDEVTATCSRFECPAFTHRCTYGACVSAGAKCNGKIECADGSDEADCPQPAAMPSSPPLANGKGCILPKHPSNGRFEILGKEKYPYRPNAPIGSSVTIRLNCSSGYISETNDPQSVCYENAWSPSISNLLGCIRTCSSLESTDARTVTCTYNNSEVSCQKPRDGVRVEAKCKDFFEFRNKGPTLECHNGSWNNVLRPCVPGRNIIHAIFNVHASLSSLGREIVNMMKTTSVPENVGIDIR